MKYIVFDLEWNMPFSAQNMVKEPSMLRGEIFEIGAVKLDEDFKIEDKFKANIKPTYYKKMHYAVAKLTKIKTSQLNSYPKTFRQVFSDFKKWCGEDFAFITWGNDDILVLEENIVIHGFDKKFIPECYDLQLIFDNQITKENRQHSLSSVIKLLGEPEFDAHDALNDAISTAFVCHHLDMKNGISTYSELIAKKEEKQKAKNEFTKKSYKSAFFLLKAKEIRNFTCENCKKQLNCGKFISKSRSQKLCIVECSCGKKYFVRVRIKRNEDKTLRGNRMVYDLNETNLQCYNNALEKSKEESAPATV